MDTSAISDSDSSYSEIDTNLNFPVAEFSIKPESGHAPLTVKFSDLSSGSPTKWKWTFGDGKTSTHQNPTHKYSKGGKFTVTLKVTNEAGSDKETKTKCIVVNKVKKPVAEFSASVTSGDAPLTITFTDESTEYPKWRWWTFGDGDGSSSEGKTITHTYSEPGKYTVTLKARNDAGYDRENKLKYIIVTSPKTDTESIASGDKEGAQDLKITDKNLKALQNQGTWVPYGSGELLVFDSAKDFDAPYQEALIVTIEEGEKKGEKINATNTSDYEGSIKYWGECVSLAKALSGSTVQTSKWIKGCNVVSSGDVDPGSVIATFNSKGNYYGHTAIFRDYIKNSEGKITGIKVWDQNYTARHAVGRHNITSKATKYYVVQTK